MNCSTFREDGSTPFGSCAVKKCGLARGAGQRYERRPSRREVLGTDRVGADSASPTPLIRAGVSLAPDSEWPGRESKPRPARNGCPEPSRLLFLLTARYRASRQRSSGHRLQCRGSEEARELGRHLGNGPGADAHGAAIFVRDKVLATPSGVLL